MKLKPLADRLIVETMEDHEITKSGIILPDTIDKEKPEQGKVVALGPGKLLENGTRSHMEVNVGDIVVFKKYAPDEVTVEGKEYLVLSENDIMAVITE